MSEGLECTMVTKHRKTIYVDGKAEHVNLTRLCSYDQMLVLKNSFNYPSLESIMKTRFIINRGFTSGDKVYAWNKYKNHFWLSSEFRMMVGEVEKIGRHWVLNRYSSLVMPISTEDNFGDRCYDFKRMCPDVVTQVVPAPGFRFLLVREVEAHKCASFPWMVLHFTNPDNLAIGKIMFPESIVFNDKLLSPLVLFNPLVLNS